MFINKNKLEEILKVYRDSNRVSEYDVRSINNFLNGEERIAIQGYYEEDLLHNNDENLYSSGLTEEQEEYLEEQKELYYETIYS